MPSNYSKKEAGRDTGASKREVSEAWHQARTDAQSGKEDKGAGKSDDWKRGK